MKCNFCDNEKFVDKMNARGVLEAWCTECLDKDKIRKKREQIR